MPDILDSTTGIVGVYLEATGVSRYLQSWTKYIETTTKIQVELMNDRETTLWETTLCNLVNIE